MIKFIKELLPTISVVAIIVMVLAMPITLIAAPPLQTSSSPVATSPSIPDPALLREAADGISRLGYSTGPRPDNSLQVGIVVARQTNGDLDIYYIDKDRGGQQVAYYGKSLFSACAAGTVCADFTNPNNKWRGVATRTSDGSFVLFQFYDASGKLAAQILMFYASVAS
ncbi:MAG: hypothetical protein HZB77_04455 [Chloroflexi bacterium]|nr:hypothetical protein [Chloroflexota bacterium]